MVGDASSMQAIYPMSSDKSISCSNRLARVVVLCDTNRQKSFVGGEMRPHRSLGAFGVP
jgi:hypothetical protein